MPYKCIRLRLSVIEVRTSKHTMMKTLLLDSVRPSLTEVQLLHTRLAPSRKPSYLEICLNFVKLMKQTTVRNVG